MAAVKESACSSLSHVGQILFEYLSELSRTELDLLYADAPSVRVIFREAVPPVAQQLVMRLLLGGARPFQESVLKRWCATLSALPHTAYLSVLQRLQILLPQKAQKPGQAPPGQLLMLHKTFQSSLSAYLQGAQEGQLLREPTCPGSSSKDADVLLRYALASWESFLGELLDPGSQSLLADLASVLNFKDGSGGLTAAGFQFVLDERQQQLWRLVISFLKKDGAAETGADGRQRALQALLAIGELGLGERLASSAPRPFLRFLVDLGVLYEAGEAGTGEGAGTGSLLITPAALALFRRDVSQRLSRSAGSEAGESQGLIVESNFKVYGYISSPLQALLLGHFCEILVRLPNLVVGQLTAESVLKAMSQGIRAAHMLRYLEAAAHPQQRLREGESGEGSVPSNVCGQLEVWESSRSRAASSSAVLFEWSAEDCEDTFEEAKKLAQAQGALLWSRGREADRAPMLVVRPEAAARLRELLGVSAPKPPNPPNPVQPAKTPSAFARSLNPSKRLKLEKDL